jgi:hypothetical protein
VSYVPEEDKLYINRETFDCIKNKVLKWNNKQLNNPDQIYRKNKFLNSGWVLETPIEKKDDNLLIQAYQKLREEMADNILNTYIAPTPAEINPTK